MLSYDEAIARILDKAAPLGGEQVALLDAPGRVLAQDLVSGVALPPFANSAMDGYAVRFVDVGQASAETPVLLPVAGEIAAGQSPIPHLPPGTALRIMTGAPLPAGADTVVPVEDTAIQGHSVQIFDGGRPAQFVRPLGEDIAPGQTVMTQGHILRPADVAAAAAIGLATLSVYRRPRVAIISTGDELVEPGSTLAAGQIFNSNAYALAAQVTDAGGIVVQRLLARDTPSALRAAFDACQDADMILTSGGVSVGTHDHVKPVFSERGTLDFWRVAIRPGKPLAFGTWGEALFWGLPGNPVSSLVTFELFARPALRRMLGCTDPFRPTVQAMLTTPIQHPPGRRSFLRGTVTWSGTGWHVHADLRQGSHQISALPHTNSLLIMPEDHAQMPAGATLAALLLDASLPL